MSASTNWMDRVSDDLVIRMRDNPISVGEYIVDTSPIWMIIIVLICVVFVL